MHPLPRKVILNIGRLYHSDGWMSFCHFFSKTHRYAVILATHYFKPKRTQSEAQCNKSTTHGHHHGDFSVSEAFQTFSQRNPASHAFLPLPNNIEHTIPVGFWESQLLIPPLQHRKRQKANYLHNLKPSVMHVCFTLGASLGGSWYANRHHAFRPVEQNADYL